MNENLVSVIVPVYNGAQWINTCFNSILNQNLPKHLKLEICVCDDCSTDDTQQILQTWLLNLQNNSQIALKIFRNTSGRPKGVGYAKNRAIDISSGTYLCFQDIDDVMFPNRITAQYNAAIDLSDKTLIGSKFTRTPENSTKRFTNWANNLAPSQLKLQIYTSNGPTVIMPTWFCHRNVFKNLKFSEQGKGTPEDLILFYQHLDQGGEVFRVDEYLVVYTYHPGATTFSINEETIWNIRVQRLEEKVLKHWHQFTIWNAGKQGRKFYKSLKAEYRKRVGAMCDVDPKKIKQKFYIPFDETTRRPGDPVEILHFKNASKPFVICVKIDLTQGEFENNLLSLNLEENTDYIIFS